MQVPGASETVVRQQVPVEGVVPAIARRERMTPASGRCRWDPATGHPQILRPSPPIIARSNGVALARVTVMPGVCRYSEPDLAIL